MAAVPYDVSELILSKLPTKSLLRFSCVCKTWYSIVSDLHFCKMIMRPGVLIYKNSREFSTITLESLLATKGRAPTPLSFPRERGIGGSNNRYRCLGSCNGLICMYRRDSSRLDRSGLIVCNPSTRKFKKLPHPQRYLHYDWCQWNYVGFGYDESIDDYKLVWINFRDASLDVLTLKSNTWRRQELDDCERFAAGRNMSTDGGVLCNRAIHWIANCSSPTWRPERCILALNLATEKFRVFSFSHSRLDKGAWIGSLDGECLWLCNHVLDDGFCVSNLWVMKEYGVESSWTKLLSIRGYAPVRYPIRFSKEKEGNEMVLICMVTSNLARIVKLRVEGEEVKEEKILLLAPYMSSVILHMGESVVSIN